MVHRLLFRCCFSFPSFRFRTFVHHRLPLLSAMPVDNNDYNWARMTMM
jgi:hypothetical protein